MAGVRRAPSHYPIIPSMIVRFLQGFSSVAVATIMIYFIWHVNQGQRYDVPRTFVVLLATGLLTECFLIASAIVSCCVRISPIIYMVVHTILLALWTVGAVLLVIFTAHTLRNACDLDHWGKEGDGGQWICKMYKALFAFVFLAWFSTLCAIYLDVHVRRKQTRHGAYARMQDFNTKRSIPHDDPWSTELTSNPQQYSSGAYGRHSEQYGADGHMSGARSGYGPVGEFHAPDAEQQLLNAPSPAPGHSPFNVASLPEDHQPAHAPPNYDTGYQGHSGELFYGADTKR